MMFRLPTLIAAAAVCLLTPGSAGAQPVAPVSAGSAPAQQFYVLSFTDAPIAEVAEAVVGGALARDLAIDPAIEGAMSFTAEGAFTAEALLQEFGTAALDQDVALMQSRAGDLALVPRTNMAAEMRNGAVLVALTSTPTAPEKATATAAPIVYGRDRWWEGPVGGLLIFLTGAVSGAGALYAGHRILRPIGPASSTLIRISHTPTPPVQPTTAWADDPELTIPRFEMRPKDN